MKHSRDDKPSGLGGLPSRSDRHGYREPSFALLAAALLMAAHLIGPYRLSRCGPVLSTVFQLVLVHDHGPINPCFLPARPSVPTDRSKYGILVWSALLLVRLTYFMSYAKPCTSQRTRAWTQRFNLRAYRLCGQI